MTVYTKILTPSVILGFAVSAAILGAYGHAIKFVQASLYFAAIAEVAANPLLRKDLSRGYVLAWCMIVVTPWVF